MNPLILLTTLFSILAFGAALPANAPAAAVTVSFAGNTECAPGNIPEASVSGCVTFPPGTQSLRVTGVQGGGIRYNSRTARLQQR
ncbi:uncharacterized protein N0V89_001348 [Didymosphaeria variabile]|uniref:Uncharacterized protein n=1 Tax=Didymosphaeria variabile TaxID=1932322 RepID=A0A9W8XWV6_9PLEO|nr:uncharacterized protein N0V89_001348 [Didymosphaeria variabile]KAJ4360781.1 hypothetical protein N0V89_001348 [Didymosphaeria variabile]